MRDDPSALARGLRKMAGRLHDEDAELVAASTFVADILIRWRRLHTKG